jgi:hypothetical protein
MLVAQVVLTTALLVGAGIAGVGALHGESGQRRLAAVLLVTLTGLSLFITLSVRCAGGNRVARAAVRDFSARKRGQLSAVDAASAGAVFLPATLAIAMAASRMQGASTGFVSTAELVMISAVTSLFGTVLLWMVARTAPEGEATGVPGRSAPERPRRPPLEG